jgi:CHASE3 domain sensor protein
LNLTLLATTRANREKPDSRQKLRDAEGAGTAGGGFAQMTIGKKLYVGFGVILGILVVLLGVNIVAGLKEQSARKDATSALENVRTMESVRYQIMLNRNNLNNFLLSGDPRDEEKVNHGLADINEMIKRGEAQSTNDTVRTALIQVESTEASWGVYFA